MFRISIGPFTTEVLLSPTDREKEIRDVFSGFLTENSPDIILFADLIDDLNNFRYDGIAPAIRFSNNLYKIRWHYFDGTFDLKKCVVKARINSRTYVLSSLLRIIYALKATFSNGLFIHAASFIKDGEAYLFPAKSGTGKSTMARIASQSYSSIEILSDEISYITLEQRKVFAYSTPFWGNTKIKGRYKKAPLKKIYFLKQSRRDFKRGLTFNDAVKHMMENVLYAAVDLESFDNLLLTIQKILPRTENNILYFTKSPKFLEVI
ncbi:MAG: hypothetical protein ACP5QK_07915 [Myxococcota bacterium]